MKSLKYGVCFTVKTHLILVLATFQVVGKHMWLVTATLDSQALKVICIGMTLKEVTSSFSATYLFCFDVRQIQIP